MAVGARSRNGEKKSRMGKKEENEREREEMQYRERMGKFSPSV